LKIAVETYFGSSTEYTLALTATNCPSISKKADKKAKKDSKKAKKEPDEADKKGKKGMGMRRKRRY
jgi:hypothetical protein